MIHNPVIDTMLQRKSIRKYTVEQPSDDVIETIVRVGQQAPFACQLGSVILSRDTKHNPFSAPLLFTICVDLHRFELIMEQRGWKTSCNDLFNMVLGIQDAALMAQNMVIAAESLGLGSCFLGGWPFSAKTLKKKYKIPERVFPLVGLTMGYPAEDPPVRPRYPLEYHLFENEYPVLNEATIQKAMRVMDEGYLAQDYYRNANYMIPLKGTREETFTFVNYSWTEHISRKLGLWWRSPRSILAAFKTCGFKLPGMRTGKLG
jgi:FMN reductase (NADPH)